MILQETLPDGKVVEKVEEREREFETFEDDDDESILTNELEQQSIAKESEITKNHQ